MLEEVCIIGVNSPDFLNSNMGIIHPFHLFNVEQRFRCLPKESDMADETYFFQLFSYPSATLWHLYAKAIFSGNPSSG